MNHMAKLDKSLKPLVDKSALAMAFISVSL